MWTIGGESPCGSTHPTTFYLLVSSILLATSCLSLPETEIPASVDIGSQADTPDVSTRDSDGPDAGGDIGAPISTCTGCAPTESCLEETGECVECVVGDDCETGVCEPNTHTCRACAETANCLDPDASKCSADFECTSCEIDDDCRHIPDQPICDGGSCVQCTGDDACAGNACNPRTRNCTSNAVQSLGPCQACETDNECQAGSLCVELMFAGRERMGVLGGYCLPIYTGAVCDGALSVHGADSRLPSIDDPTEHTFCTPNQMLTTCEAILSWGKECVAPLDCGVEDTDGLCAIVNGQSPTKCTFQCDTDSDCPSDALCGPQSGVCGGA